jgi:hypothetical protein
MQDRQVIDGVKGELEINVKFKINPYKGDYLCSGYSLWILSN